MDLQLPALVMEADTRIADAVFASLRRAIVRHELPPDFHLSVPAIAAHFGTSRSPVHEAVKRLVQEGLATEFPRRGAFVTSYSPPALVPLYELRVALEGFAAGLAAERAGKTAIGQMRKVLEEEAEAIRRDDMERHIEADMAFHRLVVAAAANPVLEEMVESLYRRIRSAMVSRIVPTGPEQALEDHASVFRAIERHDAAGATQAAKAHVMRVYARLLADRNADQRPPA